MKSLYWNARGMANAPTRLALKRLIIVNKPDFCFIAEPWISFDSFPRGWFHRLGYKLFASNVRNDLLPNLWCFCLHNLQPDLIELNDQMVAFSFNYSNIKIGITVYMLLLSTHIEDCFGTNCNKFKINIKSPGVLWGTLTQFLELMSTEATLILLGAQWKNFNFGPTTIISFIFQQQVPSLLGEMEEMALEVQKGDWTYVFPTKVGWIFQLLLTVQPLPEMIQITTQYCLNFN